MFTICSRRLRAAAAAVLALAVASPAQDGPARFTIPAGATTVADLVATISRRLHANLQLSLSAADAARQVTLTEPLQLAAADGERALQDLLWQCGMALLPLDRGHGILAVISFSGRGRGKCPRVPPWQPGRRCWRTPVASSGR